MAGMIAPIAILVFAVFGPVPALAGSLDAPFGIRKATPLSNLSISETHSGQQYGLSKVPHPHPLLSRYSVIATREAGVCKITGYAPLQSRDRIDSVVATIRQQISEVAGTAGHVTGTLDPKEKEVWFWVPEQAPLKRVSLHRFSVSAGDAV
jgi:hypothetical protein